MLIDSHTHLSSSDFDADRDAVVARALQAGVAILLDIGSGYGPDSASKAVRVADKYTNVFAAVGLHPNDASTTFEMEFLEKLVSHAKVVAIGETGLDFYRAQAPKELQEKWFRAQIHLALECNKPLIIHSRSAGQECLQILREEGAKKVGGVFHCYNENKDFAIELAKINFLVSVPGILTFKNAKFLQETIKEIPLSQIMIETDAPFLAPEPYRGKRCESSQIIHTANKLAEIKQISLEETAKITSENARQLFKLSSYPAA